MQLRERPPAPRPMHFRVIGAKRESCSYARDRFGSDLRLKLEFLLMQPTCNPTSLDDALRFAERHQLPITINLVHYSLPYFKDGEQRSLQFTEADRARLEDFTEHLLASAHAHPTLINRSGPGLASIPDWLIKRSDRILQL